MRERAVLDVADARAVERQPLDAAVAEIGERRRQALERGAIQPAVERDARRAQGGRFLVPELDPRRGAVPAMAQVDVHRAGPALLDHVPCPPPSTSSASCSNWPSTSASTVFKRSGFQISSRPP